MDYALRQFVDERGKVCECRRSVAEAITRHGEIPPGSVDLYGVAVTPPDPPSVADIGVSEDVEAVAGW